MHMRWTVLLQRHTRNGSCETVQIGTIERPLDKPALTDFGLSQTEARMLLLALQQADVQHQIRAYYERKRACRMQSEGPPWPARSRSTAQTSAFVASLFLHCLGTFETITTDSFMAPNDE